MSVPKSPPALIALTPGAMTLAQRLRRALGQGEIHALPGLGADVEIDGAKAHIAGLFNAGVPVIGICAAGILIRAVASSLADKHREPSVIAVAEDGSAVIPLLGGHHGANALARQLAGFLGIAPAITTASDVRFGAALDDLPPGWGIEEPERAKPAMAALLAGGRLRLDCRQGDADWLAERLPLAEDGEVRITITDQIVDAGDDLILRPPTLALGVGCERGASAEELAALVDQTLASAGLAAASVACVVSLDLKSDEEAVHALAQRLGVPARFFDAERLAAEKPRLANPSEAVFRATGCWGVAEGAALAAAGARAELVVPKHKSARATVAVARAADSIDAAKVGRSRGSLTIVGIGPGQPGWRTPEVEGAVRRADHLVGYGLYLDLLGPLATGKTRHESDLGAEEARARRALDLAAEGNNVALVCSGDAGIYALATLVFELLDRVDRADWRRVAIAVSPGVSAMQAAAARAGAPLGHDFCAISLSDLLTPWEAIETRLKAAAMGDFVVALYNPRSLRRTSQLVAARDILLEHRPADTPVVLARNLGRADEAVEIIDLGELDPARVDMLTLVMIGSSQTRRVGGLRWIYTPRGYEKKRIARAGGEA
jgi:cobalt-precorrin 5A hydrolase / precorrin-3B C17-methyltransferase